MIILSISERAVPKAAALLASPPPGAGGVEVRLDLLRSADPARLVTGHWRKGALPRIATCRRRKDGGGYAGPESRRERLLRSALESGFHMIDVEDGTPLSRRLLADYPGRIILSHHDRRKTPPAAELLHLYREMAGRQGVAVVKIVTTAGDSRDILQVRLLLRMAGGDQVPLLSLAMGERGRASRILAPSWGSWGTFACLAEGRETGSGQITLNEARDLYRIDSIDGSTRLAAIVGDPVSHSFSPAIHNAAYRSLGMDWRFLPVAVKDVSGLPSLIRGLSLMGLSVTAPHKEAVTLLPGVMDPLVVRLGAANTLVIQSGRIHGYNTDVAGVSRAVRKKVNPRKMTALILGAGGAARAAAVALADAGAYVVVASRRPGKGRAVAGLVGGRWLPLERVDGQGHDILINATPVGSTGRGAPVGSRALGRAAVGDLVYRPGDTPLVRQARARGIPVFGGEEVLLGQALEQFHLITGRPAPGRSMRSALKRAMEPVPRGRGRRIG